MHEHLLATLVVFGCSEDQGFSGRYAMRMTYGEDGCLTGWPIGADVTADVVITEHAPDSLGHTVTIALATELPYFLATVDEFKGTFDNSWLFVAAYTEFGAIRPDPDCRYEQLVELRMQLRSPGFAGVMSSAVDSHNDLCRPRGCHNLQDVTAERR